MHTGEMNCGQPTLTVQVVPDSGDRRADRAQRAAEHRHPGRAAFLWVGVWTDV